MTPLTDTYANNGTYAYLQLNLDPWHCPSFPSHLPIPPAPLLHQLFLSKWIPQSASQPLPEPRPLYRPPRTLLEKIPVILIIAVAGLVVVIGGVFFFLWRRPHQQSAIPASDQFLLDLQIARTAETSQDSGLAIGVALRRYCGSVWGFDGVGATAKEMRQAIPTEIPSAQKNQLFEILDRIDGLCWRGGSPDPEHVDPLIAQATDWVRAEEQRRTELAMQAAAHTTTQHKATS